MVIRALWAGMAALVLTLVIGGCGGGPERTILRGGTQHLPLLHGRVLEYQVTEGSKTQKVTLRMEYAGGNRVRVFNVLWDGPEDQEGALLASGNQVFYAAPQSRTALGRFPEYRELWVEEDLDYGTSWYEPDTGVETVFAGFEAVIVPAGTFERCYKTVTTATQAYADSLGALRTRGEISADDFQRWSALQGLIVVRWFAPGVGLVKEQVNRPERILELVKIVKPGSGQELAPADSVHHFETEPMEP